jgi:hypothetical protein
MFGLHFTLHFHPCDEVVFIFFKKITQQGSISEATVRKFCREASNLRLLRQTASIADEYTGKLTPQQTELAQLLEQVPIL